MPLLLWPGSYFVPMMSFSRENRLLNSKEFQAVFDHNDYRVANPNLLLLAKPNFLGHPRLGMVVAKKNIRRAVDRNRVKRVVRETFRHRQQKLGGVDVIFLARKGMGDLPREQQTELLEKSWRKLAGRLVEAQKKGVQL
ncbi:MAG: ribonuclease P protein component [Porticoccaceae bacterium]|nr:ribonuclease P protein component [Pseudomonadales bacterium]